MQAERRKEAEEEDQPHAKEKKKGGDTERKAENKNKSFTSMQITLHVAFTWYKTI